eukprot:4146631-Pleurochrysis_carterae.AAC.1
MLLRANVAPMGSILNLSDGQRSFLEALDNANVSGSSADKSGHDKHHVDSNTCCSCEDSPIDNESLLE